MVELRILSSTDLDVDFEKKTVKTNPSSKNNTSVPACFCFSIKKSLPMPVTRIEKLILHFHGGGFVAMNSCTHQNYTR